MNKPARMIPRSARPDHAADWQQALARGFRSASGLLEFLGLPPEPGAGAGERLFPTRVPRGFAARMRPGDRHDPLLLQVLPLAAEAETVPGFVSDPLAEQSAMPVPGLLHKYRGRALLTVTGACAVHCRYCFRRHFPYAEANPGAGDWQGALDYLRADPDIREIILSGGDPLSLSDERLADLIGRLEAIPQLTRLRLHTRLPVVLPERVTGALCARLAESRLDGVCVLHVNHPAELDATVDTALARLRAAGLTLLNQSVLLRGINDDADTLAGLSERLFAAGVLPYYLHQLDPVAGAAHFAVPDDRARALAAALRARLPGYLVPRLVREQAGEPAKTPL